MSTYLETSEISRFNASESTDWFSVSPEFAEVVAFAQQVSGRTGGAFDVTVGPLVDAWGFGPEGRPDEIPGEQKLEQLRQRVGYEKLAVRQDPPAIRKSVPGLQVDLSAIGKGHGVDRIVELLQDAGAKDIFVEIGGEVRTAGDKAGEPWKVGVQRPDAASGSVMIAHPLTDAAMATSGDYRNRFQSGGVRYSHTIDPRNGRPIRHTVASVSVIADTCMAADAWATAINVLGPNEGMLAARERGIDVMLVARGDDGFAVEATGDLEKSVEATVEPAGGGEDAGNGIAGQLLPVLVLTMVAFGIVLAAMAVGVIFGRRSISGSCGGLNATTYADGSTNCSLCGSSTEGCQELRDRLESEEVPSEMEPQRSHQSVS